jgi:hypothetical protein
MKSTQIRKLQEAIDKLQEVQLIVREALGNTDSCQASIEHLGWAIYDLKCDIKDLA